MDNRYNLIDEPWIPIADVGRVSLKDVFSNPGYRALGGNPVQKIALMKLLLAIAQAAATPQDEAGWRALGAQGLAQACLAYLAQWHDRFYLYGERPFLQMPAVEQLIDERTKKKLSKAKTPGKKSEAIQSGQAKSIGTAFYPDLPSDNNTVLSHTLIEANASDAQKAVFLVSLMNFAFGGKRVESDMSSLAGTALGNRYSASSGPSLGGWDGQLHCFPLAETIVKSIWLNLFTVEKFEQFNYWKNGVGRPIWENYPEHEEDSIATYYKSTYQATLVALSRFVLFKGDGILYLDGLDYPKVKNGWTEASLLLDRSKSQIKTKYANPQKRPWRELESLLAFNVSSSASSGFECIALKIAIERVRDHFDKFSIWCGGLKVSANSGDQSVKQDDDFVESLVWLYSDSMGHPWFVQLKAEMDVLDGLANDLKRKVFSYFMAQTVSSAKPPKQFQQQASSAEQLFWQLCERDFQNLLDSCDQDPASVAARQQLRRCFADQALAVYNRHCPIDTARQLAAWAKCRPNLSKYLQPEA